MSRFEDTRDDPKLERDLRSMTEWSDGRRDLWKAALAESRRTPVVDPSPVHGWPWRAVGLAAACLAILVTAFVAILVTMPTVSEPSVAMDQRVPSVEERSTAPVPTRPPAPVADAEPEPDPSIPMRQRRALESGETSVGFGGGIAALGDELEAPRHIIRKATMELKAEDVRAAFLKASNLTQPAHGEYVEDSALTGNQPEEMRGNLTLRVRANRLSSILNDLRDLGAVTSEQITGEDVTETVVDLEARLRNERQVEKELLNLLEKRADTPLREILDLREELNHVRESIERLDGRRQQIHRQVQLASVLLIIRPAETADQPEPEEDEEPASIGSHFLESIGDAWQSGLYALSNTMAGAVRILVGGLLWWIALGIAVVMLRPHVARLMTDSQAA